MRKEGRMERWERPPHRRCRSKNPSFSSSLLDAIYRSIDEEHSDNNSHLRAPDRSSNHKKREGQPMPAPCIDRCHCRSRTMSPGSERAANRPSLTDYRRHGSIARGSFTLTSRSSSSSSTTTTAAASRTSSSTGFSSSSDAESIKSDCIPRPHHPTPEKKTKKAKCGSIRSRLRGLRKSRTPDAASMAAPSPASPGARLASFLNALFASAGGPKKPKTPTLAVATTTAAAGCGDSEDSACSSSASSCRRSCLSKAPAMADRQRASGAEAGKRSVRFYPVSVIVDEDSRPCGHKRLQDDAEGAAPPVTARVEELLRAAGADAEAEEEGEDGGSESSSDLFELENLTVVMRGGGYRDELPVYETTDVSTNRAISRGLIH